MQTFLNLHHAFLPHMSVGRNAWLSTKNACVEGFAVSDCVAGLNTGRSEDLYIQGHFPFNKNPLVKIRTFHEPDRTVHPGCTDPTQATRAFGYCNCQQDSGERYCGQQFCQMERDISVRSTEMTWPVSMETTFKGGPKYWGWTEPKFSEFRGLMESFSDTIVVRNKFRSWGIWARRPW